MDVVVARREAMRGKKGLKRNCVIFLVVCLSSKKAEKLECVKCGFKNLPSASFCSGCGLGLNRAVGVEE